MGDAFHALPVCRFRVGRGLWAVIHCMKNKAQQAFMVCAGMILLACQAMGPDRKPFTLVVLPDTQHYADRGAATGQEIPDLFTNQTRWIVDNREEENIVFVLHAGDIVMGGG